MSIQSLKINLAEWLLLKVKYPSQFHFGTAAGWGGAYSGKKKDHSDVAPVPR